MATTSPQKRLKERNRQDRQREKSEKRKQRREDKPVRTGDNPDEDPDLAGIVAGPQPVPPEEE
jgi:hypothetical protein